MNITYTNIFLNQLFNETSYIEYLKQFMNNENTIGNYNNINKHEKISTHEQAFLCHR